MKVVSACLAGVKCNYKQQSNPYQQIVEMVSNGLALPVCPEQLGGLPTPRIPAEIISNKVINKNGEDVTGQFRFGAQEALRISLLAKCDGAILKSNSPSCGVGYVYDGSFEGKLIQGNGVFAQLLLDKGIKVISEKDLGEWIFSIFICKIDMFPYICSVKLN